METKETIPSIIAWGQGEGRGRGLRGKGREGERKTFRKKCTEKMKALCAEKEKMLMKSKKQQVMGKITHVHRLEELTF